MVKRRAVSRADKDLQPSTLPLLYKSLVPLTPERHSGFYFGTQRDFSYAGTANALPLTLDEFSPALRNFPIVLAGDGPVPTPVALVGYQAGRNDCVAEDGTWLDGHYIPAYVRRYPFALVRESEGAARNILCADLSSVIFDTAGEPDRALFNPDGSQGEVISGVMEFCTKYDQAMARTRQAMTEAAELDLIQPSTVTVTRGGKSVQVDGFKIISEEKLRALPDDTLVSLARRGVLTIYAAHHLSLSNFSSFGSSAG